MNSSTKSLSIALMLAAILAVGIGGVATAQAKDINIHIDVKGKKGDKGDQGDVGPAGPAGADGVAGQAGPPGEQGVPGPAGEQGIAGPMGPAGQNATATVTINATNGQVFQCNAADGDVNCVEVTAPVDNQTGGTGNTTEPVQCQPGTHDENGTCVVDVVIPPIENGTTVFDNGTVVNENGTSVDTNDTG